MEKEKKITRPVNECKAPLLFTIPLNEYNDEVKRERNREWFLKMQQLEKKSKQLQQKMQDVAARHLDMLNSTRQIIDITKQVYDNYMRRKNQAIVSNVDAD